MPNSLRFGMALVCVSLCALIVSSASMVNYVQQEVRSLVAQGALSYPVVCESAVREGGYGRIALGLIALLILFIPYRKRELWAWASLAILFLVFLLPVFVFPPGTSLLQWRNSWEGVSRPGLRDVMLLNWVFPAMMLIGLGVSLPSFLRSKQVSTP
jgi:hypothetical protein